MNKFKRGDVVMFIDNLQELEPYYVDCVYIRKMDNMFLYNLYLVDGESKAYLVPEYILELYAVEFNYDTQQIGL